MTLDLEPAREVLAADGVELELVGMQGTTARLAMSVVDAECAECVLPREFLEPVVLDLLRSANPGLTAVRIDDPREDGG